MANITFTKKEKSFLKKTLDRVLDDLESLWKIGVLDEIKVPVDIPEMSEIDSDNPNYGWYFIMNDEGFYLDALECDGMYRYYFADWIKPGILKKYLAIHEQDVVFLDKYNEIRESIEKCINIAIERKGAILGRINSLYDNLGKTSIVEIDMPRSQNIHEIEISEENGKKIGVINFGNQVVKIITEADIVLVNKQKDKVKAK